MGVLTRIVISGSISTDRACSGMSIRYACAIMARISVSSVSAKCLPMQLRGPLANGM